MCCNSMFASHVNGVSVPEQRSGHISVFHNGLFIVFGGYYDNDDDDDYLPTNMLWFYNVETATWRSHDTKGEHPGRIVGSSACVIDHKIYLFGGFHPDKMHINWLFSLDLRNLTWTNHTDEVQGHIKPSPRDKFATWKWGCKMVIFGGFGPSPNQTVSESRLKGDYIADADDLSNSCGWNNHLFELDCADVLTWRQIEPRGDVIPLPRAAHASTQIANHAYVSGGRCQGERLSDLHRLDLETYTWTKIAIAKPSPCGRSWHVLAPVSERHLLLYGGMDNEASTLSDLWIYSVAENEWRELENATAALDEDAPRLWHTASATDNPGEVIVFGGCSSDGFLDLQVADHTNLVSLFRFSPMSLERLCSRAVKSSR